MSSTNLMSLPFWGGIGIGVVLGVALDHFLAKVLRVPREIADDREDDEDEWESDQDDEDDDSSAEEDENMMKGNVKMILVVRNDLKMGKGKAAAQCAHAAVSAVSLARRMAPLTLRKWQRSGQQKVVVKVDNEDQLLTVLGKARSLSLVSTVIADAGRTQIEAGSKTVVAVGPGNEKLVDQVTGDLKLY